MINGYIASVSQAIAFIINTKGRFSTNVRNNTFWDVFFISLTDVTLHVSSHKANTERFPCLQDHLPHLDKGEGMPFP